MHERLYITKQMAYRNTISFKTFQFLSRTLVAHLVQIRYTAGTRAHHIKVFEEKHPVRSLETEV